MPQSGIVREHSKLGPGLASPTKRSFRRLAGLIDAANLLLPGTVTTVLLGSGVGSVNLFTGTPNTKVQNTASAQSIAGTALTGSKTTGTGTSFWTAGKAVRVRAGGSLTRTGTPNLTFSFQDTANSKTFWSQLFLVSSDVNWLVDMNFESDGSSVWSSGFASVGALTLQAPAAVAFSANAQTLDLMAQWSVANPANICTLNTCTAEHLN